MRMGQWTKPPLLLDRPPCIHMGNAASHPTFLSWPLLPSQLDLPKASEIRNYNNITRGTHPPLTLLPSLLAFFFIGARGVPELVSWISRGHVPALEANGPHHLLVAGNRPPATWHPREGKSAESARERGPPPIDNEEHKHCFRNGDPGPPPSPRTCCCSCGHFSLGRLGRNTYAGPINPVVGPGLYPFGVGMFLHAWGNHIHTAPKAVMHGDCLFIFGWGGRGS